MNDLLEDFLRERHLLILDGGLATTLEARGLDIRSDLWSAELLLDAPGEIRQVHCDFLAAGADCITSSTYQATLEGFRRRGISEDDAIDLMRDSVRLAVEARDVFWSQFEDRHERRYPLVAASVGPYGAFLADGSEYTGNYGIGADELYEFHQKRWHVLRTSGADVLACETIPAHQEVAVYLRLLRETPDSLAWLSFSCPDGQRLADGTPLIDVARACDEVPNVIGVGVNCTSPAFVADLLRELRSATGKPLFAYPNSGERYDAATRTWVSGSAVADWQELVGLWYRLGAVAIGGCCRVGPADIRRMRGMLTD